MSSLWFHFHSIHICLFTVLYALFTTYRKTWFLIYFWIYRYILYGCMYILMYTVALSFLCLYLFSFVVLVFACYVENDEKHELCFLDVSSTKPLTFTHSSEATLIIECLSFGVTTLLNFTIKYCALPYHIAHHTIEHDINLLSAI